MLTASDVRSEVEVVIFGYLAKRFPALAQCEADTPLLENGAIDSLGILELVTFLGERFGVSLDDTDFDPEILGTPAGLVRLIERKRQ
jgi:acyl carrier protein